jgi:hypothetical protein
MNKDIKTVKDEIRTKVIPNIPSGLYRVEIIDVKLFQNATAPFWRWVLKIVATGQIIVKTVSTRNDKYGFIKLKNELATIGINISENIYKQNGIIQNHFKGKTLKIQYNKNNMESTFIL